MIIGHRDAQHIFFNPHHDENLENARLKHHAFLIHGLRGIGKSHFAWQVAAYLLGSSAESLRSGFHPDFYHLSAPEEGKRIPISAVREIISAFNFTSTQKNRVLIIDLADDLSVESANALLKLIEEPPAGSTLFLISESPQKLLSTIRSRLLPIALKPLSPSEEIQLLQSKGMGATILNENPILSSLFRGQTGLFIKLYQQDCHLFLQNLDKIIAKFPDADWKECNDLINTLDPIRFFCFCQYIASLFVKLAKSGHDFHGFHRIPLANIIRTWEKTHHYLSLASLPKGLGLADTQIVYFTLQSLLFLSKKYP